MQFRVNDKLNYEHTETPAETPCGKGHTHGSELRVGSELKIRNQRHEHMDDYLSHHLE